MEKPAEPQTKSKPKVLILEDDLDFRSLLMDDVALLGCEALTADTVTHALTILDRMSVDVVISDTLLKSGNGIELLTKVRTKSYSKPICIFVAARLGMPLDSILKLGAEAVFDKPYNRKCLQSVIRGAVSSLQYSYLRQEIRVDADFTVLIKPLEASTWIEAQLENISSSGALLTLQNYPLRVDDVFKFSIRPFTETNSIASGLALVRWVNPRHSGLRHNIGVEFSYLESNSKERIMGLVNQIKTTGKSRQCKEYRA